MRCMSAEPWCCRCALLMVARSRLTGSPTGIVITASHNPVEDNGVKLIEGDGLMLVPDWEVGRRQGMPVSWKGRQALTLLKRTGTWRPAGVRKVRPGRCARPAGHLPAAQHTLR